ncbi:MAG: globin family protein [Gemmatimonadales bacterium]
MDRESAQLVQATLGQVLPNSEVTAAAFYDKLFELDPSTRPLFTGDMRAQGQKFMSTLSYAVHGLTRLGAVAPVIEQLGRDHVRYGVVDEHYDTVKRALLWALEQTLADDFTRDVESAWSEAYDIIAEIMKDAARSA